MMPQYADNFSGYQFLDALYTLGPREIETIDKDVRRVIYWSATAQKIFKTVQVARGSTERKYSIAQKPSNPLFSKTFLPSSADKIQKLEATAYFIGISKDYFIDMVALDASQNSQYHRQSIDTLHLREMTALVADFKEQVLWQGQNVPSADPGTIDANVEGIITNATGVDTIADDTYDTAGQGSQVIGELAKSLIGNKYTPPFECVMTPGFYGQSIVLQNATTLQTDLERILGMVDKNKSPLLKNIRISNYLANNSGTWADDCALIAPTNKAGESTFEIYESYPLWHYPLTTTKLGISGKVLWMGGVASIRDTGVVTHGGGGAEYLTIA